MSGSLYSSLKIELIPTGAQVGVWGATTNVNLGTAIEQAIVGRATLDTADFTANVATLILSDSNAPQDARAFSLMVTATLTAAGTVNVPAINKPYLVYNNSVGGFAITIKVAGQTGVSVPFGRKAFVYNDATDVGDAIDYLTSLTLGTPLTPANGGTGGNLTTQYGGTGQTSYTAGDMTYYASGTTFTKLPIGTATRIMTSTGSAPQWTDPATITVGTSTATANFAGGSANQLVYQTAPNTSGFAPAPTVPGYVLSWTGSAFSWVAAPAAVSAAALTGGSAGVVPYQSATSVTAFTAVGTVGYLLASNGTGAPFWEDPDTLNVAYAALAGSANNLSGGTASQIPYQTGVGTTAFIPNGTAGQLLKSNGTSAPTWVDSSTVSTSNGKLYFFGQF